jgi:hypothetical protein
MKSINDCNNESLCVNCEKPLNKKGICVSCEKDYKKYLAKKNKQPKPAHKRKG